MVLSFHISGFLNGKLRLSRESREREHLLFSFERKIKKIEGKNFSLLFFENGYRCRKMGINNNCWDSLDTMTETYCTNKNICTPFLEE